MDPVSAVMDLENRLLVDNAGEVSIVDLLNLE